MHQRNRQFVARNQPLPKTQPAPRRVRNRRWVGQSPKVQDKSASFLPPEDWHEPRDEAGKGYRFVVQPTGEGYMHVLTPQEIRDRLAELPPAMTEPLEVVQLSRMTHKKRRFPCYGMQWGSALYLYPIEEELVEYFSGKPKPQQYIEARMYGGEWIQEGNQWRLVWTLPAIKDYYLNNILIHELGHLLDNRNTSYNARERYAEWFAVEYGYKPAQRKKLAAAGAKKIVRRRHG